MQKQAYVINKRTGEVVATNLSKTQANKLANELNSESGKKSCARPYRAIEQSK